jgi:hypothetical protein
VLVQPLHALGHTQQCVQDHALQHQAAMTEHAIVQQR